MIASRFFDRLGAKQRGMRRKINALRRRQNAHACRSRLGISLENLEPRHLLTAYFGIGEGEPISWGQALEMQQIRSVDPVEQLTEAAQIFYSQTGHPFELVQSELTPDIPVILRGEDGREETHESLVMQWNPVGMEPDGIAAGDVAEGAIDPDILSIAAFQYQYEQPSEDLSDASLHFSLGVPAIPNTSPPIPAVWDVSVELIDINGNTRGWFLSDPPVGWTDQWIMANQIGPQDNWVHIEAGPFDITQVASIRLDEAGMSVEFPAPPEGTNPEIWDWNAWNHLRVEPKGGSIHGLKYEDLNGNGVHDDGEPGVPGVTINLLDAAGDVIEQTQTMDDDPATDENEAGMYWILDLPPGVYNVAEELPPGFVQSQPNGTYSVSVGAGDMLKNFDFGNYVPGSIHGYKFEDLNVDGQWDANEPGLGGVTITLTSEDGTEKSMQTDANGEFWFTGLRPGTYKVSENPPFGSFPTTHMEITITVQSRQEFVALDGQAMLPANDPRVEINYGAELIFGNAFEGSIHGYKFEDLNANGVWDAGEPPVPGVTIVLKGDDGTEYTAVTMDNGEYWFDWLPPGVTYRVFEDPPSGWNQSTPDPPEIRLHSGTEWVATQEQGSAVQNSVSFPWWLQIELQPVNDPEPVALMPAGMATLSFGQPQNLSTIGPPTFDIVDRENGLPNEVPREGGPWLIPFELGATHLADPQSEAAMHVEGSGQIVVERIGDELVTNPDFTVDSFFDVFYTIDVPGANGEPMTLTPEGGDPLRVPLQFPMPDMDPIPADDVRWMPVIFWQEGLAQDLLDEAGELWDQLITVHSMPHVEVEKPVRIQVDPLLAFGNWRPTSIHGIKWLDRNGDGRQDDDEPGLADWVIRVTGEDGMGNPVEREVRTMRDDPDTPDINELGHYWIEGLKPGKYEISESLQPGFHQTFPESLSHTVTVLSGERVFDVDFGNVRNIPGDLNGDGAVDAADAAILFSNWGTVPPGDPIADINGDGFIDAADATVVFSNWTGDPPTAATAAALIDGIFANDEDEIL